MIRLKQYMRLKVPNHLAVLAAMMLLASGMMGPVTLLEAEESAGLAKQAEESNLEGAVTELATAVSQTANQAASNATNKAINISLLIFRF